jgi:TPR repeat protein
VRSLCLSGFFSVLVLACSRSAAPTEDPQAAPAQSVITIANAFGACENLAICENECDAGSADRCRRLAVTYQFGQGVDKDEPRATELFEKACGMKDAPACVSAGQMYEYHHGVAKDDAKAAGFYGKACDIGYAAGCANFAIMLENGRGVAKDVVRARALYEDACKKGAGLACERAKALSAAPSATTAPSP